jgi:hypothetical protein
VEPWRGLPVYHWFTVPGLPGLRGTWFTNLPGLLVYLVYRFTWFTSGLPGTVVLCGVFILIKCILPILHIRYLYIIIYK